MRGEPHVFGCCGHDRVGVVEPCMLDMRLAEGDAASGEEGVCHAAADDDLVRDLDQLREHPDLVFHLGAADDDHKRPARLAALYPVRCISQNERQYTYAAWPTYSEGI